MRKIAEIRNDLNAKIAEIKGIDRANVEAMEAATRELEALVAELNAANEVEAAEQRAAENKFNQMQKNAGRQFSLLKFIREIAAGNLSGLEAEVAEMGSEEYRRLGLSQLGTVLPNVALRSIAGNNYTTAADGGNLIENDPLVIRPSLKSENSARGNKNYALSGGWDPASCGYEGARGESARVILYAATRYGKSKDLKLEFLSMEIM